MSKANDFGFGITKSTLPYREIYAQVSGMNDRPPCLVWQLGRSKRVREAALEMDAVFREVFPEACEENPRADRFARVRWEAIKGGAAAMNDENRDETGTEAREAVHRPEIRDGEEQAIDN